tara:strand:+ start:161 stop:391 length:231 start_codon:yes stop_codon:yes gene_type:complete
VLLSENKFSKNKKYLDLSRMLSSGLIIELINGIKAEILIVSNIAAITDNTPNKIRIFFSLFSQIENKYLKYCLMEY